MGNKKVKAERGVGEVTMTEEEFDRHQNSTHWLGRACGLEDMAGTLRVESGSLFAKGRDQEAIQLRELANRLDAQAKKEREKHKTFESTSS